MDAKVKPPTEEEMDKLVEMALKMSQDFLDFAELRSRGLDESWRLKVASAALAMSFGQLAGLTHSDFDKMILLARKEFENASDFREKLSKFSDEDLAQRLNKVKADAN